jgi:hypothetical protein
VVSVQFDPDVAHPARVYNVWLGGKDHFAADRLAAPGVVPVAEWRPVLGYRPQATDMYAGLATTARRGRMGLIP